MERAGRVTFLPLSGSGAQRWRGTRGRWYKGTVESYDAKKDLHHVKYADRDRADISMRHEAVILVPGEEVSAPFPAPSDPENPVTDPAPGEQEERSLPISPPGSARLGVG